MGLIVSMRRYDRIIIGETELMVTLTRPHTDSQQGQFDLTETATGRVHRFRLDGGPIEIMPGVRVEARESPQAAAARFNIEAPRSMSIYRPDNAEAAVSRQQRAERLASR